MCIGKFQYRFEVRSHDENGFLLKSFALIYVSKNLLVIPDFNLKTYGARSLADPTFWIHL